MRHGFLAYAAAAFAVVALAAGCGGGAQTTPPASAQSGSRTVAHIMSSPENPATLHIEGTGDFDSTGNYYEDGYEFPVIYKPIPQQSWVITPWLSPSQTYLGYHALGYQLNASGPSPSPLPTDYEDDKAENQLTEFDLDTNFWEGFAFELPSTQVPGVNVILAQWWQGSPFSPPVSFELQANDNYACGLAIRNNATGGNPDAIPTWAPLGTCTPGSANGGTWHTLLVHIYADPTSGEVQAWMDVTPGPSTSPTVQVTGAIGYVPGDCVQVNGDQGCQNATPSPAPTAASKYTTYIGPYRPSDENEVKIFFANIKIATSEASADPTKP
jgi:hypothetical protein